MNLLVSTGWPPFFDDHAGSGCKKGRDDDVGIARDYQGEGHGAGSCDEGCEHKDAAVELVDEQGDEHGGEGVIKAEGVLRDETATEAAHGGADHPGEKGCVAGHYGLVDVPGAMFQLVQVDGKGFIHDAVAEHRDFFPAGTPIVDGQGGAHEKMAQVDNKGGQDNCGDRGTDRDHGDRDELPAASKDAERHETDLDRGEPRFLSEDPHGEAQGDVTDTDGPDRLTRLYKNPPFFTAKS